MPDKTSLLREKLLDLFMDAPIAAAAKSFSGAGAKLGIGQQRRIYFIWGHLQHWRYRRAGKTKG